MYLEFENGTCINLETANGIHPRDDGVYINYDHKRKPLITEFCEPIIPMKTKEEAQRIVADLMLKMAGGCKVYKFILKEPE